MKFRQLGDIGLEGIDAVLHARMVEARCRGSDMRAPDRPGIKDGGATELSPAQVALPREVLKAGNGFKLTLVVSGGRAARTAASNNGQPRPVARPALATVGGELVHRRYAFSGTR